MYLKRNLFLTVFSIIIGFTILSCNSNKKKYVAYQCPMNCQKDTVYSKPGKCPVCIMDLEGIEEMDSSKIKINN